MEDRGKRSDGPTFRTLCNTILDVLDALPELLLRVLQVLVGTAQVLHFIVQLLLDLRQLLGRKGGEIDCELVSGNFDLLRRHLHPLCCPCCCAVAIL